MKKWECKICSFVLESEEAPGTCPFCWTPSEQFAETEKAPTKVG